MKTLSLFFSAMLLAITTAFAQAPGISYQAVVRDAAGNVLPDSTVSLRLTITDGSGGTTVYQETHGATTNPLGLVTLAIGSGTPVSGTFNTIDWGAITPWLKEEVDITGGTSYVSMGSYQLLSVPYALHAANAQNAVDAANAWSKNGNTGTNAATDFIGTTDAQDLVLKTNGTEQARLTTAGNLEIKNGSLGIGTPNPSEKLDVQGNAKISDTLQVGTLQVGAYTLPSSDGASGQVLTTDANGNVSWQNAAAPNSNGWNLTGNIGTDTATNFIGTGDSVDLVFRTDSIERARFTAAGSLITENDAVINGVTVGKGKDNDATNTAIGNDALSSNSNILNTAIGFNTLNANISGKNNTASGARALELNTEGSHNTASGFAALSKNSTGNKNTAFGTQALLSNTKGQNNTAIGYGADVGSDSLINATAIGYNAKVDSSNCLVLGGTGQAKVNVGIGTTAPKNRLHVNGAVRIGGNTEYYILPDKRGMAGDVLVQDANGNVKWTSGVAWSLKGNAGTNPFNDFIGTTDTASLTFKVAGVRSGWLDIFDNNTSFGIGALKSVTPNQGKNNTATGDSALINNTLGDDNAAFGKNALMTNVAGSGNTAIGAGADVTAEGLTNATAIGYNAKVGASNSLVLGDGAVNVGIGISDPAAKLDIEAIPYDANQSGGIRLISAKASDGQRHFSSGMFLKTNGGGEQRMSLDVGNIEGITLFKDGNVGIGTTSPSSKLEVEGQVRINGFDSQLLTGDGKYTIGGAKGWNPNRLYINGWNHYTDGVGIGSGGNPSNLYVTGNVVINGNETINGLSGGGNAPVMADNDGNLYKGTGSNAPIQIHHLLIESDESGRERQYEHHTGIKSADWDCVCAGDFSTALDIDEGSRRPRKGWLYDNGTDWHYVMNMGAHSSGITNTEIKLICFAKSMVNWNGYGRGSNPYYGSPNY